MMAFCPHPTIRVTATRTGRTRFRLEIADGLFTRKRRQKLIVLQLEWRADVQDCTSREITPGAETWWSDATPEDIINQPVTASEPKMMTPAQSNALIATVEAGHVIAKAQDLSCDDQFAIATAVAANVGYVLTPEPHIP